LRCLALQCLLQIGDIAGDVRLTDIRDRSLLTVLIVGIFRRPATSGLRAAFIADISE
jgi:hypothetical protein